MRSIERVRNLDAERQRRFQFHRPIADQVLQGRAIEKLHHDERIPILLTDIVNHADVGMIERGSSLGFPLETRECLRVFRYVIRQKFERYETVKPGVLGFVDHAHTAAAEFLDDAVVRDRLANHWRKSYVGETGKSMKAGDLCHLKRIIDEKSRGC